MSNLETLYDYDARTCQLVGMKRGTVDESPLASSRRNPCRRFPTASRTMTRCVGTRFYLLSCGRPGVNAFKLVVQALGEHPLVCIIVMLTVSQCP